MKKDDCSLTAAETAAVRRHAERLLRKAGVLGVVPTPIPAVLEAAQLTVDNSVSLDAGFMERLYRRSVSVLRRAVDKVLAILDLRERLILVDHTTHVKRQKFVSLHDVAHNVLEWQRKMYELVEESDQTLDPDVQDQFEREANNFASAVLFHLNQFSIEAADCAFGLQTVTDLAKRFDASIYASAREYVRTNERACVVLVFNQPVHVIGSGPTMELRRIEASERFGRVFPNIAWPQECGPEHALTQMVPARWRSRPRIIRLSDGDGDIQECFVEALNSSRQVFFLICPVAELENGRLKVAV